MLGLWIYVLISIFVISIISLIGIFTISIKTEKLKKIIIYLVSFSAGALLGDVFIHLLPEIVKDYGLSLNISVYILSGILFFFIIEKFVHWQHCHMPITKKHKHPFALMNLVGDSVHNFIDGLIIGASYIASIPLGIATTIAVLLHEIPQEIGDFGILIHGGFTKKRALFINFLTALTAILGGVVALLLINVSELNSFLLPFAAGSFIYIAGSDLIPELHKETEIKKSLIQLLTFILGIIIMFLLLLVG
jgi:zinc and cadmium transporter